MQQGKQQVSLSSVRSQNHVAEFSLQRNCSNADKLNIFWIKTKELKAGAQTGVELSPALTWRFVFMD